MSEELDQKDLRSDSIRARLAEMTEELDVLRADNAVLREETHRLSTLQDLERARLM
jgi:hypothetical protein